MSTSFTLHINEDKIAELSIDCPGEKVNKLSTPVLKELQLVIDQLNASENIKALIFYSKKPNIFIAGADISEIRNITDEKIGFEMARTGQDLISQITTLPFPTIAVIDGACLGGGLELALAFDYRIVSDSPKTQLGAPEVTLGIIPGFGGTQRLPRLIPLQQALNMILSGKPVNGKKALKIHLADAYYDQAFLIDKAREFAQHLSNKKFTQRILRARVPHPFRQFIAEKNILSLFVLFFFAKKALMEKTKGLYPAPLAAIKVIQSTRFTSLQKGLVLEATEFSKLVGTSTSKNLTQLFFTNELLKKDQGTQQISSAKPIQNPAVIGAGLMGGGLAWLFTHQSLPVRLKDIHWDALNSGVKAAYKINQTLKSLRKLKPHEINLRMHKLSPTITYTGFQHIDFIIEAAIEDIEIKKSIYQELESHVSETTIIATNTSSLNIDEMASELKHPERFIGMHFFSPVNRMPLVEVIPGSTTSAETIATTVALAKTLKKTPIVVQNCPGFLINRILIPYILEALFILQEGIEIPKIDCIMTDFGMPIGPLALADEVGLDIGYKVAKILSHGYGKRMQIPAVFENLVEIEKLRGKKMGKGFYIHGPKKKQPNQAIYDILKRESSSSVSLKDTSANYIQSRLILLMINEAARCLEEGVVASPDYLDMAMIMGTGFPPFRGGLCRYADDMGIQKVVKRLSDYASSIGSRYDPAPLLKKLADSNQTFYGMTKGGT